MEEKYPHGTYTRYAHLGCKCDACSLAAKEYKRDYYNRRKANNGMPLRSPPLHGTYASYVAGCRCTVCREAKRDRTRTESARRRELIREVKDKPCTDCGVKYPPYVMEFDHLPEYDKSFNVSESATRSWERVLKEIEKCELVCANCHRIRTNARR